MIVIEFCLFLQLKDFKKMQITSVVQTRLSTEPLSQQFTTVHWVQTPVVSPTSTVSVQLTTSTNTTLTDSSAKVENTPRGKFFQSTLMSIVSSTCRLQSTKFNESE